MDYDPVKDRLGQFFWATPARTKAFYRALDALLRMQEGGIGVGAPAIGQTAEELVGESGLGEDVLGWTVSCHRSELACGDCPGCWKRARVFAAAGLMQPGNPL